MKGKLQKMLAIFAFFFVIGVCGVNSNHLRRQADTCDDVPIILPKVRLLNITRFVVGQPGRVHLRLKSSYPLEFLWFKNILKEQNSYPAIIVEDEHFGVYATQPSGDEYDALLWVKRVTPADTQFNRFTLEITIEHPCASIKMKMLLGTHSMIQRNLASPVKLDVISRRMVKKTIGDTMRLRVRAGYTAKPNERLFGPPLSISKWYRTASRSGILDSLNLYTHESDTATPTNAHNVINSVVKLNPSNYEASSNMTLRPLLQSDQGFFQCRVTYDLVRDVVIHLYVTTEFRYSDRLKPAVAVRPCSSLPNKEQKLETKNGIVQVPIRAGMENCLQCFAHGVPDFLMIFAKLNPDFSSGIHFVEPIAAFDYGALKRYIYPLAPVEKEVRHYICTAGGKTGVTPVAMAIIPYEPVKLTEVSPSELNLANTNKLILTCRATGIPKAIINFYRTPKSSILHDATPEERGWVEMESGSGVEVNTSYNIDTEVTTGIMVVEDVASDTNRGRFDYSCVARNDYSLKTGTVLVDAFNRQLSPDADLDI